MDQIRDTDSDQLIIDGLVSASPPEHHAAVSLGANAALGNALGPVGAYGAKEVIQRAVDLRCELRAAHELYATTAPAPAASSAVCLCPGSTVRGVQRRCARGLVC